MSGHYILAEDGKTPVAVDLTTWATGFDHLGRRVGLDELPGDIRVSTVFLGLDHSWDGGPPVLWETMIFGGEHDQYQERYTSHEDAVAGHAKAIRIAKGEELPE